VGDLLVGWERAQENPDDPWEGRFATVWDWIWFENEIAPRGSLNLLIRRHGQSLAIHLDPETLADLSVRPLFDDESLARYRLGLEKVEAGDVAVGISIWQDMVVDGDLKAWLTLRSAGVLRDAGDLEKEFEHLALAQNLVSGKRGLVCILMARCNRLWRAQRLDDAENIAEQWLRRAEPMSLVFARCMNLLGNIAWGRGDLEKAEKYHNRALAIRQAVAPSSLALASTYNNLGLIAANRGKLEQAETYHRQALKIRQAKLPEGVLEATSWMNLGLVKIQLGDSEKAEAFLLKAVGFIERISPEHRMLSDVFTNLGVLAWQKSQLDRAELYLSKALEIQGKTSETSAKYATTLHNLGLLVLSRGDMDKAQTIFRQTQAIYEKEAPGSVWHADLLNNLGAIASKRENWAEARDHFEMVVAINRELAPGSLSLADALGNLASVYEIMGQGQQAEKHYLLALEIYERKAPEGIMHGNALSNLAILTSARGDLEKALALSEHAYSLIKSLSDSDQSGNQFSILESGYRTHIYLLAEAGRTAEAFNISEEFRALSMLRQLGQRDILQNLFPEAQKALKEIGARCDALQNKLWETVDAEEKERLHRSLLEFRVQAEQIKREILSRSPHLVEYGHPFDKLSAWETMEPGSLVLSYLVQHDGVLVFAMSREDGLAVETLPMLKATLEEKIKLFQAVDAEPGTSRIRQVHQNLGEQLFQILLTPFYERVARSERLILIPDGPLWHLPFAALGERSGDRFRYLIEWKPMVTVASATLYDYLKKREPRDHVRIAVFGAPNYPDEGHRPSFGPKTQDPGRSVKRFRPLPGTAKEVARIASLFRDTTTFLGAKATEANFKELGNDYAWIHVGGHALYDVGPNHARTGIYFSMPQTFVEGEDNGILQYREIFDLNLDADLLVLSACRTALGKDVGGQGLLGIARAFQYAGVRNIVASLWDVDDRATAQLMSHYYGFLREGNPPAQALRRAQIEMIRAEPEGGFWAGVKQRLGFGKKDYSSHLYWAPFQLIGPH